MPLLPTPVPFPHPFTPIPSPLTLTCAWYGAVISPPIALPALHPWLCTSQLDVTDVAALTAAVQQHDVVISLVPWQLYS